MSAELLTAQEIGRRGGLKKAENARRRQEASGQLQAEIDQLRSQKRALIAWAKGKGISEADLFSLLAVEEQ